MSCAQGGGEELVAGGLRGRGALGGLGGGAALGEDALVIRVVFVAGVAGGGGVVVYGFGGGVFAKEVFALRGGIVVVFLASLGKGNC